MRLLINATLAYLAMMLGLYLSWRTWQPNLDGHWHVIEEEVSNGGRSADYMPTIDFVSHNEFTVTDYSPDGYSFGGTVNRLSRQGEIFTGCFSMEFNYHFEGAMLIIELRDPASGEEPLIIRGEGPWRKCPHKGLLRRR